MLEQLLSDAPECAQGDDSMSSCFLNKQIMHHMQLPTAQVAPDTYASFLAPENGRTDPDASSHLQSLISLLKVVFPVRPNQKTQWTNGTLYCSYTFWNSLHFFIIF